MIKEINDDHIVLEIASNVKIKIDKNSILQMHLLQASNLLNKL